MATRHGDLVLVLEDQKVVNGQSKSLEVCTMIAKLKVEVWLFDGKELQSIKLTGGRLGVANVHTFVPATVAEHVLPAAFCEWVSRRMSRVKRLVLVVDLQFGEKAAYGKEVFGAFSKLNEMTMQIIPIVYSRWANEDSRAELMKYFGIDDGNRVLNRDVDPEEALVREVDKVLNTA